MELTLLPPGPADAEALFEAIQESMDDLEPWMDWCTRSLSLADLEQWIDGQEPNWRAGRAFEFLVWGEVGQDPGWQLLGACGVNGIDAEARRANLGYWVRSGATGRGVATAAVERLADWAFRETDLERLEIVVSVDNVASRRVAERSGARLEGSRPGGLTVHGRPQDACVFVLSRSTERRRSRGPGD